MMKGKGLIIIGIIAGIVLIIIGNIDFSSHEIEIPEINITDQLEEKITNFIESIDGITGVNVMISLEIDESLGGIAVVCNEGKSVAVQSQIINLLSTLFNLSTNRIYVTG